MTDSNNKKFRYENCNFSFMTCLLIFCCRLPWKWFMNFNEVHWHEKREILSHFFLSLWWDGRERAIRNANCILVNPQINIIKKIDQFLCVRANIFLTYRHFKLDFTFFYSNIFYACFLTFFFLMQPSFNFLKTFFL